MGRWLMLGLVVVTAGCGKKPEGDYSVPGRLQALKSPNPDERYSAARSLGRHPEEAKDAVPALTEALKDPVGMVRMGAAYGLADLTPITDYSSWLEDRMVEVVRSALRAPRTECSLDYQVAEQDFGRHGAQLSKLRLPPAGAQVLASAALRSACTFWADARSPMNLR